MLDAGCTMADAIRALGEIARDHDQFVNGVILLAGSWRRAGLLSRTEADQIIQCADQASLPRAGPDPQPGSPLSPHDHGGSVAPSYPLSPSAPVYEPTPVPSYEEPRLGYENDAVEQSHPRDQTPHSQQPDGGVRITAFETGPVQTESESEPLPPACGSGLAEACSLLTIAVAGFFLAPRPKQTA